MSEIPLSKPDITEREIQAVADVMRSGRLSMGPRQARFEEMVAERCDRRHGIAVSSGTAGLHLVLLALGIGPGDEVVTTPFSFIASSNAILYVGATPVFVDIDPHSLNMDPKRIGAVITDKTKAILAVEVFGNTINMDKIAQVARLHEIPLIEDCCEALGGVHRGQVVGSFGRVGIFGFYPNKQITTGEGGMIVTDDDRLADRCKVLRNQGRATTEKSNLAIENDEIETYSCGGAWLAHERLGYNYRLSEIACAIGIVQMERLDEILEARRNIAAKYINKLLDWQDLIMPNVDADSDMSWFVFVVRLTDQYAQTERDRIITGIRRHEIGAANYFPCIHLQPFYREKFGYEKGAFPVAESVCQRTIALPFYNSLDDMQIELIVHTLKLMIQREQLLKR